MVTWLREHTVSSRDMGFGYPLWACGLSHLQRGTHICVVKNFKGAGDVAPQLKALAVLPEDLD